MSYNPNFEASKALPLEKVAKELEKFAADGHDLSKRRFSRSPPRVSSIPSTVYGDSEPPSPGVQLRDKEMRDMERSRAGEQYKIQIKDEMDRIRLAKEMGLLQQPHVPDLKEAAEANVRYRWIQQGIWDERWEHELHKIWKHELQDSPLQVEHVKPSTNVKVGEQGTTRKRSYSDSKNEYQEVVQAAVNFQNTQLSRPCYQFVYQFCEERQWIKMGLSNQTEDPHANVDTKAYANLKSRWIRDGIWDEDWTLIPGISWRHERPRKHRPPQEVARITDSYKAAKMEKAERPPTEYLMAPAIPIPILKQNFRRAALPKFASDSTESKEDTSSQHDPAATSRTSNQVCGSKDMGREPIEPEHNAKVQSTTRTKVNRKTFKNQKDSGSKAAISDRKSVEKPSPAVEEKNRRLIEVAKKHKLDIAASPRPRRTAALEAMNKLKKSP